MIKSLKNSQRIKNKRKHLSLTRKRKEIFFQKINIACAAGCSLPNVFDNMIACENPTCEQWCNLRCVGIQDPDIANQRLRNLNKCGSFLDIL